jgi:hypothetical protein|tara:strand:+ start:1530 stop:2261 length:732 start_codon:yes stop_codon:yes gene_type:complete
MKPIKKLKGKTVAIVGLGKSWFDYNLAKSHSVKFDEVWAINAVASVIFHDRVFMMDPPSRFLDTQDAGGQTDCMKELLTNHNKPIYTCENDARCKNLVEYPVQEIVKETNCHYLNNTVAYAVAFAYWNDVANIKLFGIDFTYKNNLYFAEAGRACVEFWLVKCMEKGIQVEVASSSSLLDTNIPGEQRLYGYHRLKDPYVPVEGKDGLEVKKISELRVQKKQILPQIADRYDSHLKAPEPNKW